MRHAWILTSLLGCSDKSGETGGHDHEHVHTERPADILALEGDAAAGADLYAANCAACHGADGSGGTGPALTEEVPAHESDEELLHHIIEGPGDMPSFDWMTDQQLADLLAYLRATFGE